MKITDEAESGILSGVELAVVALLLMVIFGGGSPPDPMMMEAARQQVISYSHAQSDNHDTR